MIRTPEELTAFRAQHLTAAAFLNEIGPHLITLVGLPVGVGKSTLVDRVLQDQTVISRFDLRVYLASQLKSLRERDLLLRHSSNHDRRRNGILLLTARPQDLCGDLNAEWLKLERIGCAAYAKNKLCRICVNRSVCGWRTQLSPKTLQGVTTVFGTQAQWISIPNLLTRFLGKTGASRALILLDEATLVTSSQCRRITSQHLTRYAEAIKRQTASGMNSPILDDYRLLCEAAQNDNQYLLQVPGDYGGVPGGVVAAVQRMGVAAFGTGFRYIGHELRDFTRAALADRQRLSDGSLIYIKRPEFLPDPHRSVILSASLSNSLVENHLGLKAVHTAWAGHEFLHQDTRLINLNWCGSARSRFYSNGPTLLWCIAQLIEQNVSKNQRTLLIASKAIVYAARDLLQADLDWLGVPARVVAVADLVNEDIGQAAVIPIIHYGIEGENRFEEFQNAYCLNSYNVPDSAVFQFLNDAVLPTQTTGVRIETDRNGRRVVATTPAPGSFTTAGHDALAYLETATVMQAVGRCRFLTQPRTVLTQQRNPLPVPHHKQFENLEQLRRHFGLVDKQTTKAARTCARVQKAKAEGFSQRAAAKELGLARSTVERWWNAGCPDRPQ